MNNHVTVDNLAVGLLRKQLTDGEVMIYIYDDVAEIRDRLGLVLSRVEESLVPEDFALIVDPQSCVIVDRRGYDYSASDQTFGARINRDPFRAPATTGRTDG